jgi:hypothetical protein
LNSSNWAHNSSQTGHVPVEPLTQCGTTILKPVPRKRQYDQGRADACEHRRDFKMAKTPTPTAPQQQGSTTPSGGQMGGNTAPTPQQGQQPIIRDWASI